MNRRFEITKSLLNNPDFQTIESIARSFNVSARTIRSDVEYIEKLLWEYGFDMVKSRKLGIRINADDISMDIKKKILFSISGDVYQEEKSRIDAIINYLLLKDSRFTLNSIIDNFMVSKNTAIKDLKKCEEILKGQHIYLESNKKRGTHLLYSEYHYRQAMLNSICKLLGHADFQKLYQSFDDMSFLAFDMYANDAIDRFTRSINLVLIKNFIKKYESDLGIKFSDESFVRVFLYLCIAITRIREGRLLKSVDYTELYTDTENVEWIQKNHKLLEAGMQISFDENECLGIIMVLMSCNKYYLHLEEDVDEGDLEILVKRYVGAVENDFKIDLAEDEGLINNLIMHMRPAIYRAKYNIKIDNPLTEEIMEKYTDIFEVCKKSCKIFEEPWNVSFDDGEIAYLVMHIASSIESNKKTKGFFHNVLVVCHSGIGASNMVVSRLLTEFPNIIIKGVCSVKELYQINPEVELIISTVQLYKKYHVPVVYVSPLLNMEDIRNISKYIGKSAIEREQYQNTIVEQIMQIILQECNINDYTRLENKVRNLFQVNKTPGLSISLSSFLRNGNIKVVASCQDWKEAIRTAGKLLVTNNLIKESYYRRIIEECQDSNVNFVIGNGLAIPHVKAKGDANETCMALVKVEAPVYFPASKEAIHYIILLAANKDNSHVDAIRELTVMYKDEEVLDKLKRAKTSENLLKSIEQFENYNYM